MSNYQNLTVSNDTQTTATVPVTKLLRQVARVTTEMAKILVNATTTTMSTTSTIFESRTDLPIMTTMPTATTSTSSTRTTQSASSWNLTKGTTTSGIVNATNKICSTTTSTTTVDPFDEFGPPEGVEYIFVPLGVMIFVIVLSAVVLIVSRRRKLERLRHRLMPLYNFDPGEEGEDDWETELLDEGFGSRQRRQGYQSMDSEENAELFGGH